MGKLDGKVAIITGGSGGIGKAAAQLFAAEGGKVMLVDIDGDALKGVVSEIGEENAAHLVANVADPAESEAFVAAAVERFGGVDIAILNAGIEGQITSIVDYPLEMFDKVIDVNVRGVFLGLKSILPVMSKSGGGSIVITSSTAGIRAVGGMSAYVTSKHAVIGLMRTAAMEGAPDDIRVNTVNPSPIDTRMMLSIEEQAVQLEALNRLNRLHRDRYPTQPELTARIEALEMAFKLQTSAGEVFDLNREPKSVRELYGDNLFSRHCLTARRLVQSGVRFVEIIDGAAGRQWDAHGNRGGLIGNHRSNAARTDQGISSLITDLKSRGMLDETLIIWATEFGRTPFEEANRESKIGRGHHHKGFTLWMAGGGLKRGMSYGATDELGMHAVQNPAHIHDIHATVLHLLGLDHERLTFRHNSRDVRLTDVFGNVLHEIVA